MNQRIQKFLESTRVERYPICIEKARLLTKSHRETEGTPTAIRRAKALAEALDKIPIFIEDGELIGLLRRPVLRPRVIEDD